MSILSIISLLVTFIIGFLCGRSFIILKRGTLQTPQYDAISEAYTAVKQTISPPTTRIVSPSKVAFNKSYEKDLNNS